jgi:hypothetical protein
MSLMMRPPVLMLSFALTYTLLPMAMNWVNFTFVPAFVSQQGGHSNGLVGILTILVFSCVVQHQMCKKVLDMIPDMPDRVAAYWGGQAQHHDEKGSTHAALGIVNRNAGSVAEKVKISKGTPPMSPEQKRQERLTSAMERMAGISNQPQAPAEPTA